MTTEGTGTQAKTRGLDPGPEPKGRRIVVKPNPEALERCSLAPASVDVDQTSTCSPFQSLCSFQDMSSTSTAFSTRCEARNAVHFENADLSLDAADVNSEDDDSDDGNNGDFSEVAFEPFVEVTRGRSSNSSRSASRRRCVLPYRPYHCRHQLRSATSSSR